VRHKYCVYLSGSSLLHVLGGAFYLVLLCNHLLVPLAITAFFYMVKESSLEGEMLQKWKEHRIVVTGKKFFFLNGSVVGSSISAALNH